MEKFRFNESDHSYWLGERRLISVTEALSLVDTRWKDPWYLERGRIIHRVCELYLNDELDESTVDERIVGYFTALKSFLIHTRFVFSGGPPNFVHIAIEKPMYCEKWMVAGRMDLKGKLNNRSAIIDFKSGVYNPVDELQESAYWYLNEDPLAKVFGLYLHETGKYHLRETKNPKVLWPTFQAILTTFRWKMENLK